jgi:hypothetical protein
MMPAYLMEQLARYQGEELTRQADRAQIRPNQEDPIHRRSSRLRLRRLRFKLGKIYPPVEIDLRGSGSVREAGSRLVFLLHANRANRRARDLTLTRLRRKPST